MKASDVMEKGVVSVSPELPVAELESFLSSEEISGAPVVDDAGKLLGIVSQTDVIRVLSEESSDALHELLAPDLTVEQIMTSSVLTVTEDEDVKRVARKLVDGHVHRAIVVDGDGVSGIITSFDLLRLLL
jgi:CBS domain-containing protein